MKIIVSTKAFGNYIQTALDNNTRTFDIIGERGEIIFYGDKQMEFCSIEPGIGDRRYQYLGNFNPMTWKYMMDFLKQLPEQPIVIEFLQYAHTKRHEEPEMTLSQFVINF